jgi:hypothetical protein
MTPDSRSRMVSSDVGAGNCGVAHPDEDVADHCWWPGLPALEEDEEVFRREERREVIEAAAVGGAVHESRKAHEEEAQIAAMQAQQAQAAAQAGAEAAKPPEAAEAKPAAPGDLTDEQVSELERVAKLKEEGILTDEEFAAEKKKILGL